MAGPKPTPALRHEEARRWSRTLANKSAATRLPKPERHRGPIADEQGPDDVTHATVLSLACNHSGHLGRQTTAEPRREAADRSLQGPAPELVGPAHLARFLTRLSTLNEARPPTRKVASRDIPASTAASGRQFGLCGNGPIIERAHGAEMRGVPRIRPARRRSVGCARKNGCVRSLSRTGLGGKMPNNR